MRATCKAAFSIPILASLFFGALVFLLGYSLFCKMDSCGEGSGCRTLGQPTEQKESEESSVSNL